MVLHTTFAGSNLGTTGSGTEDSIAAAGFFPSGDSEVQMRGGGLPSLIGYDHYTNEVVQIGAAGDDLDTLKIGLNTWSTADYIITHAMKSTGGAAAKFGNFIGSGQPVWLQPGIPLDQDADWDIKVATTTASMSSVAALYLSYGTPIPAGGGQLVSRQVAFSSDDGVWPATGTSQTISDLDPRFNYRVAGLALGNVEDKNHTSITVTSPSNNTTIGAVLGAWTATTFHANSIPVWFPHDSIVVSGVETVTVSSSSEAAQKPTAYVYFEKLGGRGGGGATAAQPSIGTSGAVGGGFNLGALGSLFGR